MNNGPRSRLALAAILVSSVAVVILGQAPAPPAVAPLSDLVVPPGFSISVFASGLPGARLMTVSPEGVLLVARRRTHEVLALPDKNKDGQAEPQVILTGLTTANSLAFRDGYLYIATTPAVMRVRWTNGAPDGAPVVFAALPSSTPAAHTSRVLGFGPDGRLYVSIGSSCDVCIESDPRRTTIQVFDADGTARPYATGLRNANGFDWDPATGRLWAGDNGQDGLGPDFPPDEINLVEAGKHYGFPFFIGRNRPNPATLPETAPHECDCRERGCAGARTSAARGRHRCAVLHRDAVSGARIATPCFSPCTDRPRCRRRSATKLSAC